MAATQSPPIRLRISADRSEFLTVWPVDMRINDVKVRGFDGTHTRGDVTTPLRDKYAVRATRYQYYDGYMNTGASFAWVIDVETFDGLEDFDDARVRGTSKRDPFFMFSKYQDEAGLGEYHATILFMCEEDDDFTSMSDVSCDEDYFEDDEATIKYDSRFRIVSRTNGRKVLHDYVRTTHTTHSADAPPPMGAITDTAGSRKALRRHLRECCTWDDIL